MGEGPLVERRWTHFRALNPVKVLCRVLQLINTRRVACSSGVSSDVVIQVWSVLRDVIKVKCNASVKFDAAGKQVPLALNGRNGCNVIYIRPTLRYKDTLNNECNQCLR